MASGAAAGASVAGLAVAFSLSGHTRSTDPQWAVWLSDLAHVAAGAVWSGGLVALVVMVRHRRRSDREVDALDAGTLVARFSSIATVAVVAVIVAGLVLAWAEVRPAQRGHLDVVRPFVGIKVGLVGLVGLMGAYNRFRLVPVLRRKAKATTEATAKAGPVPSAWAHLSRTLRGEVAGLVAVLVVTAVLVNTVPARTAAGVGTLFSASARLGTGSVNLVVDPDRAGSNSMHLYVLDQYGRSLDRLDSVQLEFSLPANQIGPIVRTPLLAGPGHYQFDGNELATPGRWTVTVTAKPDRFTQARATFRVPVHP